MASLIIIKSGGKNSVAQYEDKVYIITEYAFVHIKWVSHPFIIFYRAGSCPFAGRNGGWEPVMCQQCTTGQESKERETWFLTWNVNSQKVDTGKKPNLGPKNAQRHCLAYNWTPLNSWHHQQSQALPGVTTERRARSKPGELLSAASKQETKLQTGNSREDVFSGIAGFPDHLENKSVTCK